MCAGGCTVRAQCMGRGVRCRLRTLLRVFLVRLHAGYSAVCAAGWCGAWGCAGAVDMGVRGSDVICGWVYSVSGVV